MVTSVSMKLRNYTSEGRKMESSKQIHVLVFPLPVQGHINPMLQFSKRLASKGLNVTFITTKSIIHEYPSTSINVRSIEFPEADSTAGIEDFVAVFRSLFTLRLADFIQNQSFSANPPKFLIYDSVLPWALEVARGSGMDGAPFFTQSWAVNAVYFHVNRGHLKVPPEAPPIRLPAMPELEVRDLPSFAAAPGLYPSFFNLVVSQFSNFREAKWVFCNTFHELEDEILDWMASQGIRITGVGPTVPSMYLEKSLKDDANYGLSLFKPDNSSDCIKWLDSKQASSVVYASFGSLASLGEDQMQEIAWGLKRSNRNFLWVVRESEQNKLPADIRDGSSDKGLLLSWCPQLEVLAHESVGCFMTHAGWNSTMEALCLGVPMVTMPQWTDQPMNAKYVEDVWGVGVRIRLNEKGIVTKEEVERCVRELMEGEKSMGMKRNSERWKKLGKEAVDGGTSDQNIDRFLVDLKSSGKDVIQGL